MSGKEEMSMGDSKSDWEAGSKVGPERKSHESQGDEEKEVGKDCVQRVSNKLDDQKDCEERYSDNQ